MYGLSYYQEKQNEHYQNVLQLNENVSTQINSFFSVLENGIETISQKLILYKRSPNHQRLGELHDITRTVVNLHHWIEQIIVISEESTPITSSDLLTVPFGEYPHQEWLAQLSKSENVQIFPPLISLYGITHNQQIVLIGKRVLDFQKEIIGYVIITMYPDVFFTSRFHKNLLPFGASRIMHQNGTTISMAGCKKCEEAPVLSLPLLDGQLSLLAYTRPVDLSLSIRHTHDLIIFSGMLLSVLLITLGLYMRRIQSVEHAQYVTELEKEVYLRTHALEQAKNELEKINETLESRVAEEIKKFEAQSAVMIQQSKMASMGEMINAIAHQWKQPLNSISLNTQNIPETLEYGKNPNESIDKICNSILKSVSFMNETINDFRDFFKPSQQQISFRACDAIREIHALIEPRMKSQMVEFKLHERSHFICFGFVNEFKQVILNILNNAQDVFEEKKINNGRIDVYFDQTDKYGIITIQDNGGGIPSDLLPSKLFDPYVSTKGNKGTGIGLQLAKTIIEDKMNGRIRARNTENGAEFIIELPLHQGESDQNQQEGEEKQ